MSRSAPLSDNYLPLSNFETNNETLSNNFIVWNVLLLMKMKCLYFSNGEDEDFVGGGAAASSHSGSTSRVSWACSLSLMDTRSNSRSHFDSESTEFSDTVDFHHFLAQRCANDLRLFSFSDLKSTTHAFSWALLVSEGGFGSVYRSFLDQNDVAIKQLKSS